MANRSYIYAADFDKDIVRDVGEWATTIPVTHLLLLSGNPKLVQSTIWNYDGEIAITGDAKAGRERLFAFIDLLSQHVPSEVVPQMEEAKKFLLNNDVDLPFYLLEPAEIADLAGDPPEEAAQEALRDIRSLATQVDQLVSEKPDNLFEYPTLSYHLKELGNQKGWDRSAGFYFSRILYFHSSKERLQKKLDLAWGHGEVGDGDLNPAPPSNSRLENAGWVLGITEKNNERVNLIESWDSGKLQDVLQVDFQITPAGYDIGITPELAAQAIVTLFYRSMDYYEPVKSFDLLDLQTGTSYVRES